MKERARERESCECRAGEGKGEEPGMKGSRMILQSRSLTRGEYDKEGENDSEQTP